MQKSTQANFFWDHTKAVDAMTREPFSGRTRKKVMAAVESKYLIKRL